MTQNLFATGALIPQTIINPPVDTLPVPPLETSVSAPLPESYRDFLNARDPEEVVATEETLEAFYGFKDHRKFVRFVECRTSAYFARSISTGQVKVIGSACRDRWCMHCARARAAEVSDIVSEWLKTVKNPRLLTLTLKSSQAPLVSQLDGLYKLFREWRLLPEVKNTIVAGIWFLQLTVNEKTGLWHPHLHCLIVGKYRETQWYRDSWLSVTGDSHYVNIEYVRDPVKTADYVGRYVARPAFLKCFTPEQRLEIVWACHSRRLFGTWGRKDVRPNLKHREPDIKDWVRVRSWLEVIRNKENDPIAKQLWMAWMTGKPIEEPFILPSDQSFVVADRKSVFHQAEFSDVDGPPWNAADAFS